LVEILDNFRLATTRVSERRNDRYQLNAHPCLF